MLNDSDFLFKILVIGPSKAGKSALLSKYVDDIFIETHMTTIGVDFKYRAEEICNKKVKLQIWDTAGQMRFRAITSSHYRGGDVSLIVMDPTVEVDEDDTPAYWFKYIEQYCKKDALVFFVVSKYDLYESETSETKKKEIEERMANYKQIAESNHSTYFQVSSKTGYNVRDLFVQVARKFLSKKGVFTLDRMWEPNQEMDKVWGEGFRKVVIWLLLFRKKGKNKIPKPIIFSILQKLSELYVSDGKVPWEKQNTELEPKKEEIPPETKPGY